MSCLRAMRQTGHVSPWFCLPELMESAMYLFRATGDHTYLQLGLDALESIERIAKTPCGYASVRPRGSGFRTRTKASRQLLATNHRTTFLTFSVL